MGKKTDDSERKPSIDGDCNLSKKKKGPRGVSGPATKTVVRSEQQDLAT